MISSRYSGFNAQTKKVEWGETTVFLFILMILQMIMYKLLVTTIYVILTVYFHYLMALLLLTVTYGCSFYLILLCSEITSMKFRKMSKNVMMTRNLKDKEDIMKDKENVMMKGKPDQMMKMKNLMMRNTSLPSNGIKVHTLIYCRNLDTFVLDGRDGKSLTMNTINIDIENLKKNTTKWLTYVLISYIFQYGLCSIAQLLYC